MANKSNEGSMPAEQGGRERGGTMDDRDRGHEEDVRGVGEREQSDEELEDADDAEDTDTEDTEDEAEEGSF